MPVTTSNAARQVTNIENGIKNFVLSPDENRVLSVFDSNNKQGSDDVSAPRVITRLQFKKDSGDGYITGVPSTHVHVLNLKTRKQRRLTTGAFNDKEAVWSPDGKHVVFVSSRPEHPDSSYANDLWLLNSMGAHGSDEPNHLRRLTSNERTKSDPQFSPTGKMLAYLSAADGVYGNSQLRVLSVTGGEVRELAVELDRRVLGFEFSPNGDWIYFIYPDRGGRHLARVHIETNEVEVLLGGKRVVNSFDIGASGVVVANITLPGRADNFYVVKEGQEIRKLTSLNSAFFSEQDLGHKKKIQYAVDNSIEIEAFVTLPPKFTAEKRYPAILKIHGGPVSQVTWGYDFESQLLARHGYVVIEPNPRGSSGRGQAFVRAIEKRWGITDFPDVMAAVDRAINLGYADPNRLAVTGYSYGGYMTNVVVTRTDRFRAAASGAGHSLIIANYGHDIWRKWYDWELGLPAQNRADYARLSPLLDIADVRTPTLLLGGENDWNVPILNSELFYQSLRTLGIKTKLVVYPDTHHGGWPKRFEQDYWKRVIGWFDRFVKNPKE